MRAEVLFPLFFWGGVFARLDNSSIIAPKKCFEEKANQRLEDVAMLLLNGANIHTRGHVSAPYYSYLFCRSALSDNMFSVHEGRSKV